MQSTMSCFWNILIVKKDNKTLKRKKKVVCYYLLNDFANKVSLQFCS